MKHLAILVLAVAAGWSPLTAAAQPYNVNTTADLSALCSFFGPCSLRGAIRSANLHTGPDIINVPKGTYGLTRSGGGPSGGDLDVTSDITIRHVWSGTATIDGNGGDSIEVHGGASLTLEDMALADASRAIVVRPGADLTVDGCDIHDNDRGVESEGDVVVTSTFFDENLPSGAIAIWDAELDVLDSDFTDNYNTTSGGGGAIYAYRSAVSIDTSLFGRNRTLATSGVPGDGQGGAVFFEDPTKLLSLVIVDSYFAWNEAGDGGGAVRVAGGLDVEVVGSSFYVNAVYQNSFLDGCGGALSFGAGFDVLIENSSFLVNGVAGPGCDGSTIASDDGATVDRLCHHCTIVQSPGFAAFSSNGHFVVQSSIIEASCGDQVTSGDYNIELGDTCFVSPAANDLINTLPHLEWFADNGGPTPTIALTDLSPQDFVTACLPTDQRGELRPAICDAGAYERNPL